MSLLLKAKQDTHRLQTLAGRGAGIVLVSGCGEYTATFACATRCAELLGSRALEYLGERIGDETHIPCYKIPLTEMHEALQKLSTRYSVALVEYAAAAHGGMFVLVWRIEPSKPQTPEPEINWNEY